MKTARTAVRSDDQRRPSRRVIATVPSEARADGRRAVSEVTLPRGSDSRAISQKKNGGLWVLTLPLTWVTSHWPSTTISRAPSPKKGSSGAHRS